MATTHQIIPEHEQQCVWMDAGLVNYKLCDKNFDCETCPFDTIMRTQYKTFAERACEQQSFADASAMARPDNTVFEEVIEHLLAELRSITLPDDRIYYSTHTWVQRMNDGSCRIGIDGFIAKLLHPIVGVAAIQAPSRVAHGDPYAWLIRDDETFVLHNPISGYASKTNTSLTVKSSLLTNDPYNEGWLMHIIPSCGKEHDSSKFYTPEEYRNELLVDIEKISTVLNSAVKKNRSAVGSTMYDGGARIETIEQFIGEKRYTQLLSRLIHPH